MNDKEVKSLRKKIEKISYKWYQLLGLKQWVVHYTYFRDTSEFLQAIGGGEVCTSGSCNARWEYKEASISWNLPILSNMSPMELEITIIHEHVHCLTDPMASKFSGKDRKLLEVVVTDITNALYRAKYVKG